MIRFPEVGQVKSSDSMVYLLFHLFMAVPVLKTS